VCRHGGILDHPPVERPTDYIRVVVDVFRIGEFARLGRVSVKSLRHYDSIGLLPASRVDGATGYRYYRADQLPRLHRILLLRELGFGLREVAALLDADIDAMFADRQDELLATLAATEARLRAVRARRAARYDVDVVVRPTARTLVACRSGGRADALFTELEAYVAGHGARSGEPPMMLVGAEVAVAVPLVRPVPEAAGVTVRRLPAVPRMACAIHRGGYAGTAHTWQRMLGWLESTGERLGGPLREVYLRFGADPSLPVPRAYVTDADDLVTELQVPLV
jgi:DNA-binding transcriptional MerR regulator